jgi:hypothetical protein
MPLAHTVPVTKRTLRRGRVAYAIGAVLAVLPLAGCGSRVDAQPQFVEQSSQQLPQVEPTPIPAVSTGHKSDHTPTAALHVSTRTVTETVSIPYPIRSVDDPKLEQDARHVLTRGVPGVRTLTFRVTVTGGRQTAKELVRSVVTKRPVSMVVAVGTKKPERRDDCNANYGGCVPVAVDVDCAGGGNGPVYQRQPVEVVGIDIYHLDLDENGEACDGPPDVP